MGGMPPGLAGGSAPVPGPAPAPAAGPAAAAPTPSGPGPGAMVRIQLQASIIMQALANLAAEAAKVSPTSDEAMALSSAMSKLASTFKKTEARALEQSEIAAMQRTAQSGPGVFN